MYLHPQDHAQQALPPPPSYPRMFPATHAHLCSLSRTHVIWTRTHVIWTRTHVIWTRTHRHALDALATAIIIDSLMTFFVRYVVQPEFHNQVS